MKLTLIMPKWQTGLWNIRIWRIPPLGLALLAALTPEEFDIELIDENVEKINFHETDVVGISVMTPIANRAYEIADKYRAMGAKVILGGIHASMLPEEAIKHADSVVIGEADDIWPNVMDDFKQGKLKRFYRAKKFPDLSKLPFSRKDLLKRNKYFYFLDSIQTSRGCPFGCDFCSVSEFNGRIVRHRPVEHIIEEIKNSKSLLKRYVFFADDNIAGDFSYAKKLFEELIPLNIKWVGASSLPIAKNEKLLKLAAESGCKGLFIGFESLSQNALKEVHKAYKVEEYERLIKKIHDHGIIIQGAFIFGFDNDDKTVFKKTVDFCYRNDIEIAQFTTLTPLPGTKLFNRLQKEKRIFTYNWDFYDTLHAVFKPKNLTPQELQNGVIRAYQELYSTKSIFKRIVLRAFKIKSLHAVLVTALSNSDVRRALSKYLNTFEDYYKTI